MDKQEVRERVWAAMQKAKVARFPGARGRIPNFTGSERAAQLLAETPEWRKARAIKANPDQAQLAVRARALADGKLVYMAVPKLRDARPFMLLDPDRITMSPWKAASIKGAETVSQSVGVAELEHIDLIVCGTVAVNRHGVRIGKGGGYSDIEFALGVQAGVIDARTVIATTVHPLQVLDEDLPETGHDFRVRLVVTPGEVIRTKARKRPKGIVWEDLTQDKIAEIPVLGALQEEIDRHD
jgi:5-formyltetrahydrofolate cyclo-ligase